MGGSCAVPEETPGLSLLRSKVAFQDLLSRLIPQGTAVGKRSRGIDYGWGWGSVAEAPGREKGWEQAIEVSWKNKPKGYLFCFCLSVFFNFSALV